MAFHVTVYVIVLVFSILETAAQAGKILFFGIIAKSVDFDRISEVRASSVLRNIENADCTVRRTRSSSLFFLREKEKEKNVVVVFHFVVVVGVGVFFLEGGGGSKELYYFLCWYDLNREEKK